MTDPRSLFAAEPTLDLSAVAVAVLGCGSLGGVAAWCLASAGVRTLHLVDRDRLEVANCRRHVCGRSSAGQPKPAALARFLAERFEGLTPGIHDFCLLQDPARLRRLIESCSCLLVAVDDEAPKHLVDGMARYLGRPAVYGGVYGGGWAAEVILTDPASDTPCYACTARGLGRFGVTAADPTPSPSYALPAARPSSEWVRADLTSILPAAALAARLTVACLARSLGHDHLLRELRPAGHNAWRLALREVPPWELAPWTLKPWPVPRTPNCPGCGTLAVPAAFEALLPEEEP